MLHVCPAGQAWASVSASAEWGPLQKAGVCLEERVCVYVCVLCMRERERACDTEREKERTGMMAAL